MKIFLKILLFLSAFCLNSKIFTTGEVDSSHIDVKKAAQKFGATPQELSKFKKVNVSDQEQRVSGKVAITDNIKNLPMHSQASYEEKIQQKSFLGKALDKFKGFFNKKAPIQEQADIRKAKLNLTPKQRHFADEGAKLGKEAASLAEEAESVSIPTQTRPWYKRAMDGARERVSKSWNMVKDNTKAAYNLVFPGRYAKETAEEVEKGIKEQNKEFTTKWKSEAERIKQLEKMKKEADKGRILREEREQVDHDKFYKGHEGD